MTEQRYPDPCTTTEPLCGWEWYHHSKAWFTWEMFNEQGMEINCNGQRMPTVHAGNDRQTQKEIMQVVKSYREGK